MKSLHIYDLMRHGNGTEPWKALEVGAVACSCGFEGRGPWNDLSQFW